MTDCLKKKPHRGGNEKNNFLLLEPELAKEWHPTKNIWEPQELTAKSGQKVWWQCLKNPSHEWEQTLHNRSRKRSGCPY